MGRILPSQTVKIRALSGAFVAALERARPKGLAPADLEERAKELTEAFADILSFEPEAAASDPEEMREAIQRLDAVYSEWRRIGEVLSSTLEMAYRGELPASCLSSDRILFRLQGEIGEPLAELYARFHMLWKRHLESYPWDAYLSGVGRHQESERLEETVKALVHGDELDHEDAAIELTGPLRPLFRELLVAGAFSPAETDTIVEALARRLETVVIADYWRPRRGASLLKALSRRASRHAPLLTAVQELFASSRPGNLEGEGPSRSPSAGQHRNVLLRSLALHPDTEVRRYAVANLETPDLWLLLSPPAMPCATLLSLTERVTGRAGFDPNFGRIFFSAIYKRLFYLPTRSDVIYARGIVDILSRFDFFLEDEYFEKMARLMDHIARKEIAFSLEDRFLLSHLEKLRRRRAATAGGESARPDFGGVPAVILRKLAREGHFWLELSSHPLVKIAKETLPHIGTPDRALLVASRPSTNQEVLRELGKRREFFKSRSARMALLSNPRTPLSVSSSYLPDLGMHDAKILLQKSTLHPELRILLQKRLAGRR